MDVLEFVGRWLQEHVSPKAKIQDLEPLCEAFQKEIIAQGFSEEQVMLATGQPVELLVLDAIRAHMEGK